MANISQELAAIMAAIYGRDVRQSIHDAIDKINKTTEVAIIAGTAVNSGGSSSTGYYDGTLYINTDTWILWRCIGVNSWENLGCFVGNGIAEITGPTTVGLVDTYTIVFDNGDTRTFSITNGRNGTDGQDGTPGSKWYKGTALYGTGTSITGFPGNVNDFYLNSNTGMVYTCTSSGGALPPDPAQWDYVMTLGGGGGGSTILVIDQLDSTSSTDALSANQGRVLNNLIGGKADAVHTHTVSQITDFPTLATVATSGSFNDLNDTPSVDSTYDSTSADAQAGTAVAEAVSTKANISDVDCWYTDQVVDPAMYQDGTKILVAGTTSVVFTVLKTVSAVVAFVPYGEVDEGADPIAVKKQVVTTNATDNTKDDITITLVSAVTAAQEGSTHDKCKIKLRMVK